MKKLKEMNTESKWDFEIYGKDGLICDVIRKEKGDYEIIIQQKTNTRKCNKFSLYFPSEKHLAFFVDQLYEIRLHIFSENLKRQIEEKIKF